MSVATAPDSEQVVGGSVSAATANCRSHHKCYTRRKNRAKKLKKKKKVCPALPHCIQQRSHCNQVGVNTTVPRQIVLRRGEPRRGSVNEPSECSAVHPQGPWSHTCTCTTLPVFHIIWIFFLKLKRVCTNWCSGALCGLLSFLIWPWS